MSIIVRTRKLLPYYFILFFLSACAPVANMIVGYHEPTELKRNEIEKLTNQLNIASFPIFSLDTNYYTFIQNRIEDSKTRNKLLQPILILYFENDTIASLNNNCFFPGLPNIHWNEFGTFNVYPPRSGYYSSNFKQLYGAEFVKLLSPINNRAKSIELTNANQLLLVTFNKSFKRQTKNLAKLIKSKYKNPNQQIVFINNDNYLVKLANTPSSSVCQP